MRIKTSVVLTNDDGIEADGLNFLATALEPLIDGELYVIAPDQGYSGCSQQVTMNAPIPVTSVGPNRYAVSGSPADCVRLALTSLAPSCGLVISGINHGGNMGHDILLSGTVGAARESAMMGVTSIALSQYFHGEPLVDWGASVNKALQALDAIMALEVSDVTLWNVNLPHGPSKGEIPLNFCRPCGAALPVVYQEKDGSYVYDGSRYHDRVQQPGTDVTACFNGAIAISRLAVAAISINPPSH